MTPIELLQQELDKWNSALSHLEKSYLDDDIPENVYRERRGNLIPKIAAYHRAIALLSIAIELTELFKIIYK